MPILRNLFKRTTAAVERPADPKTTEIINHTITIREEKTPAISILSNNEDEESNTYKLWDINDSGVYLPPSPTEKKSFWKRSPSSQSLAHREALRAAEIDGGFAIPRESFESYRRSFDISARSPVVDPQRTSLDSRPSRISLDASSPLSPTRRSFDLRSGSSGTLPSAAIEESESEEDEFKNVDLNDDSDVAVPRKRNFLARFSGGGSGGDHSGTTEHLNRSTTLNWKKEHHRGSEELNDFKGIRA